jgi:hypothetical protein
MNAARPLQLPIEQPSSYAYEGGVVAQELVDPGRESSGPQQELFPTAVIQWGERLTVVASAGVERRPAQRQLISHHWECTVVNVGEASFTATLRSLRDPDDSEKEAEIPIEEVTPDDLELLHPGAVFYWTIGYDISSSGTRRRASQIKFRRLPAWTKKDIERVQHRADELFALFGKADDERREAG